MEWRLELMQVPVADVDRAKAFYEKAGFVAEHDHQVSDEGLVPLLSDPDGNRWSVQSIPRGEQG